MHLPGRPGDSEKPHFLTTFYTEELFKLEVVDFVNSNDNTFLKFYNQPLIQRKGGEPLYISHNKTGVSDGVLCGSLSMVDGT